MYFALEQPYSDVSVACCALYGVFGRLAEVYARASGGLRVSTPCMYVFRWVGAVDTLVPTSILAPIYTPPLSLIRIRYPLKIAFHSYAVTVAVVLPEARLQLPV